MRERHHWMWAIFAACSLALLGVLGWVSAATLSLESREREARADARQQEVSRQALWRMDSALAPILAREAARPYFHYQPFYAADRAYTSMLEEVRPGEVLVPSPLLQAPEKFVKLHFQISPRGDFTSPQAPTGTLRDLAKSVAGQALASEAETELGELRLIWAADRAPKVAGSDTGREQLFDASPLSENGRGVERAPGSPPPRVAGVEGALLDQSDDSESRKPGRADYLARRQVAEQAAQSLENNAVLPRETTLTDLSGPVEAKGEADESTAGLASREEKEAPAAAEPANVNTPGNATKLAESSKDHPPAPATESPPGVPATIAGGNEAKPKDKALADAGDDKRGKDAAREVIALSKEIHSIDQPRSAKERRDEHVREPVTIGAIRKDGASIGTPVPVVHGPFAAHWLVGDYGRRELALVREVSVGSERFTQGVWMDWEQLRPWLLDQTRDLTPTADLRPITLGGDEDPRRLLASIPAELDIGAPALGVGGAWSPMMTTIIVAWLASLAAIVAVGLVIRAAAELATRRGRFVSAVTHELRTPLTTLCMYSQMLEGGMVGEESRREYLGSLRRESERLAKIVENVLEFARLGARRRAKRGERVEMRGLLLRVGESLRARVSAAGMGLKVEIEDGVDATLAGDEITIERIVTNLVENACKYGASPAGVVTLRGLVRGSHAIIEVSDEGPGISAADRDRIFEPFERGHDLETETKQGLGLGLPLARGLARELGGDLRLLEREGRGATFELSLPRGTGH